MHVEDERLKYNLTVVNKLIEEILGIDLDIDNRRQLVEEMLLNFQQEYDNEDMIMIE